ncbi:collagen alpha-1(I) chain-like [Eubalaena glacialis]|uniref:collagen alpha-1(I) chain-like n=1 Tax=Eubalaena glacialis TaxID=27606 RepID=UPI002A59D517|nr:collagen alpha-1(I) chain-like [Eubalaena glacialis]
MVLSARRAAPGGAGSPNSGGSRGRGRGSWVLPPYRRPRSELRCCETERRARPWSQNPPSVPAAALAAALLPRLGTRASGAAVAGPGAVAARVPPAASAPPGEPAPGRRRADGRARAGCKRGSCSPTDWRCPAEGVSARPRRPAPGARQPRRLGGSRAGGGRGGGVTARRAAAGRCHPLPPAPLPPRRSFGFAAGFRESDRAGAAPGPEVCPGSRAAGSWRARRAGQRPAAPRAGGRGGSDPGAGRQCRRAGPEAPGVAGPALPGGCGPGEPADPGAARVCGFSAPRAPRSWRAPGQLAAAAGTETPQRTGSPAGHPRSCPRNLAPSEQDTLGRFIASQPSRVGPSEPRAMHGRRRSHGPTYPVISVSGAKCWETREEAWVTGQSSTEPKWKASLQKEWIGLPLRKGCCRSPSNGTFLVTFFFFFFQQRGFFKF